MSTGTWWPSAEWNPQNGSVYNDWKTINSAVMHCLLSKIDVQLVPF